MIVAKTSNIWNKRKRSPTAVSRGPSSTNDNIISVKSSTVIRSISLARGYSNKIFFTALGNSDESFMNPIHIDIEVINYQGSANAGVESLGIFFIFYVDICILCWQHRCRGVGLPVTKFCFILLARWTWYVSLVCLLDALSHFFRNIVNIREFFGSIKCGKEDHTEFWGLSYIFQLNGTQTFSTQTNLCIIIISVTQKVVYWFWALNINEEYLPYIYKKESRVQYQQ